MRDMTKADTHGRIPRLRRSAAAAAGVIMLLFAAATLLDAHGLPEAVLSTGGRALRADRQPLVPPPQASVRI